MDIKKLNKILEALRGVTYAKWNKLSMCIDEYFKAEASKRNKMIQLTDLNNIVEKYKHYSSTI